MIQASSRRPAPWIFATATSLLCVHYAFSAEATVAGSELPTPGQLVDGTNIVFNPGEWKKRGFSTRLVPWRGEHIVFLTTTTNLDVRVMARFLSRLDAGWKVYADLTGRSPGLFRQWEGLPTITAVPDGHVTCGLGCGYIGATGIEVAGFYTEDYPLVGRRPESFPHYYFYEMGRNYYTFGDRHSSFTTGFAVFMRYVCMDALGCQDPDRATRETIEIAEELYAKSSLSFLKAFTMVDGWDEKAPRLKTADGGWLHPSDQPVLYASAMLKLHRDCGGNAWLQRFFAALATAPAIKPDSREAALRQSLSWLMAASGAANRDLTDLFVERWRLPLNKPARDVLAKIRWDEPNINVLSLAGRLPADPFLAGPKSGKP